LKLYPAFAVGGKDGSKGELPKTKELPGLREGWKKGERGEVFKKRGKKMKRWEPKESI